MKKIAKSLLKNFSINEHNYKLEKLEEKALITNLKIEDILIENIFNINKDFYFKKTSEFKNDIFLKKIINNNKYLLISPILIKELILKNNISKTRKKYIITNNNILKNPIFNEELDISDFIIEKSNNNDPLYIETSLFNYFYLSFKTLNKFSKLIIIKNYNIYLMKRKNIYYIFIKKIN
jgi:hypothetical protein